MAVYTGNVNRVTGLSGVDTESMIDKMMKAESAKYEKLQKDEIWVTWRQEAYREVIKSMQDFQNKWFSSTNPTNNIGFESAWNNFTTSVKDSAGKESSAITVKGSSAEGKYEIEVKKVAQTESLTGNSATTGELVTGKTADEIYTAINDRGALNFKFSLDGKTKEISITKDELTAATGNSNAEKVKNLFSKKLEDAFGASKVNVNIKDNKLSFSANATSTLTIAEGAEITKDTSTTHSGILDPTKEGKYELKVNVKGQEYTVSADLIKDEKADDRIDKIVKAFKSAQDSKGQTVDISKTISINISKEDSTKNLKITNSTLNEEYSISGSFTPKDVSQKEDFSATTIKTSSNLGALGFTSRKVSTEVTVKSKLSQALGDKFKDFFAKNKNPDGVVVLKFGGKDVTLSEDDTIESLSNKIAASDAPVKLGYNQVTGRFKLEAKESGSGNTIDIQDENTKKFLNTLGIDVTDKSKNGAYVQGQDAVFVVDGIEVTRSSNDVNMNGLEFTINGVTNGKVTIEANTDEDATFKKLKEFVDDYNKLIESIEGKVNEKREKSGKYGYYDPLLPDQKDSMKEDEIKKWEEKAKTGLLYNDDLLKGILSTLRNIPYQKIDVGGVQISLSDIGISHGKNYNTGKLEIDEATLKKAISEKGDTIAGMFTQAKTGIADKMKDVLENAIGKKGSLRHKAGIKDTSSVANNLLTKELQEISKRLAEEKERLYNKEMNYFEMFAQMEAAMNKQNSQMSMMLSLLGQ